MADRNVEVFLTLDLKPFIEAMDRAARAMARVARVEPWLIGLTDEPHHPRPLCIDGDAYHRRRRARKRRNR